MSDKVIHVHNKAEYDALLSKNDLVIVDFSATWCGPCKMIAPKFSEFSNKYGNVAFLHVDIDEVPDFTEISGVPTFYFIKKGEIVQNFSGAKVDAIEKGLQALSQ
eukprot:TRINITY_DN1868_c0_g1_i1.p1 TRINITY_DN1868_c0_g1~~TRINITY_DN1868_c0_g1_i1.p1  ORF type:complete len:105 (-),score=37.46 TRINITY_DN1868_c0_g1_i1:230-544(-)